MERLLKLCAHCGGKAEIDDDSFNEPNSVRIECKKCGNNTGYFYDGLGFCAKDVAVAAWNKRVDADKSAVRDAFTIADAMLTAIKELSVLLSDRLYDIHEIVDSLPLNDKND